MDTLNLLLAICERGRTQDFEEILRLNHIELCFSLLCRGTASSEILDYLSLERSEKSLLLAVASSATLPGLMRDFRHELYIDIPGNGIVATLPLNCVAGQRTLALLTHEQRYQRPDPAAAKEDSAMANPTEHELIVVIANEGHTDLIMDAARRGGAGGGTALHAKGTGAEYARKFFGLSLAGEKELILIVSPIARRDEIMRAIVADGGPGTRAQGIVFSLPVSSVAGLRASED